MQQQHKDAGTADAALAPSAGANAYKAREKRFKQMTDAQIRADADVIDVRALRDELRARVQRIGTWRWRNRDGSERARPVLAFGGLADAHEGFVVIPDALDAAEQLDIAHACLTEYVEAPHVTNMHQQHEQVAQIWRRARQSHPRDPSKAPALAKLHWGASGFHYDWTARKYYPHDFSRVPERLERLGAACAAACGETLRAEAVIVNFYKKNSTMGGHQDDVELTMAHPVVSLSLGSDCVFLKGSLSKRDAPLEVLLRSGDLAVLGGKSRLSYHGIAKVLPTPFRIEDDARAALAARKADESASRRREGREDSAEASRSEEDIETEEETVEWEDELRAVQSYLDAHRININIRQVYADPPAPAPKRLKTGAER